MVHDQCSLIGGAEIQIQRETQALRRLGHPTRLLGGDRGDGAEAELSPHYGFPTGGSFIGRNAKLLFNPAALRALRVAVRDFRPDVVHCHTLTSGGPLMLAVAAAQAPSVATLHDYSILFPRLKQSMPESRFCGTGNFACCAAHAGRLRYTFEERRTALVRQILRRFGAVVVPSRAVQAAAMSQGLRNVWVVHGCIGEATGLPEPSPTLEHLVTYVGRLEPEKGVVELLDEFASLRTDVPNATLQILGEGSLRETVQRRADEIGRAVVLRGRAAPSDVRTAISLSAVVVVPSIWPEPFGLVGPESFSCGVPVVGSGRGGMADWLVDGVNGLVADPEVRGAMAASLRGLLSDRALMARCQEGAASTASQFTPEHHARELVKVYERVRQAAVGSPYPFMAA